MRIHDRKLHVSQQLLQNVSSLHHRKAHTATCDTISICHGHDTSASCLQTYPIRPPSRLSQLSTVPNNPLQTPVHTPQPDTPCSPLFRAHCLPEHVPAGKLYDMHAVAVNMPAHTPACDPFPDSIHTHVTARQHKTTAGQPTTAACTAAMPQLPPYIQGCLTTAAQNQQVFWTSNTVPRLFLRLLASHADIQHSNKQHCKLPTQQYMYAAQQSGQQKTRRPSAPT
jgi:hypothetical protein